MLYIVGTPIGNLDDLSLRQAKTLASSDIILAEDTRSANILLDAIYERFPHIFPNLLYPQRSPECSGRSGANTPNRPKLISYYKEKEFEKLPEVIQFLKEGKTISLISESGMPLISDPGYILVKTVIKKNIPFTVIPGPSAITTSLLYSGFNPAAKNGGFMFLGYFPRQQSVALHYINIMKSIKKMLPEMIFAFYESPNRIKNTLRCIDTYYADCDIVVCRELTKKFEEVIRGKAEDLLERDYKGEITVLIQ